LPTTNARKPLNALRMWIFTYFFKRIRLSIFYQALMMS